MKMCPSKKPYWASSLSYSVAVLVILLVFSLVAISIVGPERSWISLPSPWVWRQSSNSPATDKSQLGSSQLSGSFGYTMLAKETTLHSPSEKQSSIQTTSVVKRYTRLERLEASLAKARSAIKEAAQISNMTSIHEDPDYVPQGPVYMNANAFHR
ncbi:hypothetical protein F0562_008150 [Nyssa sinensis]|uniref:Uncharacterized protein n=1 Tax=Nyssa sinensis TaxID=561372 RepID=A0A5J5AB18_9ASTE|nr:hypothetical protein F0562_008150 [Nyssa sinensis]